MKNKKVSFGLPLILGILAQILFLMFQARGIYGGDSGDLVTAAFQMGIPHPPGYSLYTFLGWVVSRISIFTPAWRVGLLSSIPHAVSVGFIYLSIVRLTKRPIIAIFSSLALAGNYLFFLYSVTPEVFAMLDLFVVLIVYLLLAWQQTKKQMYLLWATFVFGLSLTHHQIVLFFVPAIVYWVWNNRSLLKQHVIARSRGRCNLLNIRLPRRVNGLAMTMIVYFFFSLIPFLYIPIAARGNAIINWDRPVDLSGFIRLITRADYGTFVSGGFYGAHLVERSLQVKGYVQLILLDFTAVGLVLTLVGCLYLWRKNRPLLFFIFLALLFLGPGFFFYASFPLFNRFNWGTYERFLLPSYIFLYVLVGLGLNQILILLDTVFAGTFIWKTIGRTGLILVLFLYPAAILSITAWRFVGITSDETANNLGIDILSSVPKNAIVLVSRDTPLFTSQYVRYALGLRPDVVLLHANKMSLPDYPWVLRRVFPTVVIPKTTGLAFTKEFILANRDKYPIFSNSILSVDTGWFWVPYGLLYKLTSETSLPDMDTFYSENKKIWDEFHDPTTGILHRYNHLMLSDVRDVYETSRIDFGKTMLKAGKLDEARRELTAAISYAGDTQTSDAYTYLGLTELFSNNCDQALADFAKARSSTPVADKELTLYEGVTYRDCVKDASSAKRLLDEYEKQKKSEETPLQ